MVLGLTELFVFLTLIQTFVLFVLNLFLDIQIHVQIHNINVLSRDGGYPDFWKYQVVNSDKVW